MEWHNNSASPEENFIPGIFNYCDRWCERCLYTDRCRTFAMEKAITKEMEEEERRKKAREENKAFWDQIDKAVSEAADIYDELIPTEKKDSLTDINFLFDNEEEDAEEAIKDFKENMKKAENHLLSKAADKYENATLKWFKEHEKNLQIIYDSESGKTIVQNANIGNKQLLKQLADAIDVIRWYQILIAVKIQRALSSSYEEEQETDFFEDIPKDSEGSAMVALKGIERSLGAWNLMYKTLDSQKESIAPFITFLFLLKAELVKAFPGATTFQWPPES